MGITIWKEKLFILRTEHTMYVMERDRRGILRHVYWGSPAGIEEDFESLPEENSENGYHPYVDRVMEEYSSFGAGHYKETALKLEYHDGTRDFRYRITDYKAENNTLSIRLDDSSYPCGVTLIYEIFEKEDIIRRQVQIQNEGDSPILLERIHSAQFGLPGTDYRSVNFNGSWAAEFRRSEDTLSSGKKVYESLRGNTGHVANPCFILHRNATEETGDVYFGLLAYSGNFKVVAEATPYEYTNVLIGMSDTDFAWKLDPGKTLSTPSVYCGYTAGGLGAMSQSLHRFERNYLMPGPFAGKELPVLYNSWYATYFDVQCEEQMKLAEKAASLGVELFVVDDGWFGTRQDDTKGLGDWYVDSGKFPDGLSRLVNHVKSLGMRFGIWIEPEMVNPDSELYRTHPDWVYRFENRKILQGRNQYVLDLTREDVADFMIETLDKLLSQQEISYIKWDMNRSITETGICGDGTVAGKQIWLRHMNNFYRVVKEIRARHPDVEFEACASGGARVDLGAMQYFHEYWPSDNTDPFDRLFIQNGYSLLYPPKYMRAWVTDVPEGPTSRKASLSFALHTAMCGSLGIGNNLNRLEETELALIREQISVYKRIRPVIQFGDLYRLKNYEDNCFWAVQYVKDGQSIIFAFLTQSRFGKNRWRIKAAGLQGDGLYQVCLPGGSVRKSGAFLMNFGLEIRLSGDYDSCMILIEQEA